MLSGSVIFYKIASMCLLIFVGFMTRRMKLVPENYLSALSHYILKVATPCYILTYLPQTVSRDTILDYWYFPVLGFCLVAVGDGIGLVAAKLLAKEPDRATVRFLIAMPNWVFLALAVCEPMFGMEGMRVVLLFNVGVTAYIWSFGLTGFRQGMGWAVVKTLFLNMQILTTVCGLILALTVPFLAATYHMPAGEMAALPFGLGLLAAAWETVTLIGGTCLALSIYQIGLRLAGAAHGKTVADLAERACNRNLAICFVTRLFVAPLIIAALLVALIRLGVPLAPNEYLVVVIIFSMPTAVASLSVTDVYGGNTLLAARSVLLMTLASMVTVPLIALLAEFAIPFAFRQ